MGWTFDDPLPVTLVDPGTDEAQPTNQDIIDKLEELRVLLASPITSIGYRSLYFFASKTQSSNLDMVPVDTGVGTTLEASDADEVWGLFAWELSFSAACTLTFEGGAEDFVLSIPSAGIYSGVFREFPYCQTTVAQGLTITVSAGVAKGGVYAAKGL